MDLHGFVMAVLSMRQAQKRYFRSRGNDALDAAITLEREVDAAIESYLHRDQGELFDMPAALLPGQNMPGRDSQQRQQ